MAAKNTIDLLVQDQSQETLNEKDVRAPATKRAGEININVLNFITASWMTPIFLKGAKKTLVQQDLPDLPKKHKAEKLGMIMDSYWSRFSANDPNASPFKELVRKYGLTAFGALLLQLISASCSLAIPIFLEQIILYLTPSYSKNLLLVQSGYGLALILFGLQLLNVVFSISSIQLMNVLQIDIKTVLIGAIYEKSLRLNNSESGFTAGKILNLVNVDVEKLANVFRNINTLIVGPIQLVVCAVLLGNLIGYAIWGSLSTLFAVLGLLTVGIRFMAQYQREFLQIGDKRLKFIREILYGIKVIKLRSLEDYFYKAVSDIREKQLQVLKKYYYVNVFFIGLMQFTPIGMPIGGFLMYSSLNGPITPQVIFPALALLQNLFQLLHNLPGSITGFITAVVSYKRVLEYLKLPEGSLVNGTMTAVAGRPSVTIENCSFEWEDVKEKTEINNGKPELEQEIQSFKLDDLSINIPIGMKCGIVGPVGSGKSTLLSALIGEVRKTQGEFFINGSIGYCSQQPWILSETILENILFEKPLDKDRLANIIRACELESDLEMFPDGLKTEIGEKGVNLSGGQKARVSLARAMYFDPDILLLDDPISALDPDVGGQVFQNAIKKYLQPKTVLLVTHQLHLLPELDYIIVMDKGKIVEQGSYAELIQKKAVLAKMMESYSIEEPNKKKETEQKGLKVSKDAPGRKFMVSEDQAQGSVDWKVFWHYFDKCGGWLYVTSFVVASLTGSGLSIFSSLWLSWWSSNKYNLSQNTNMLVYGLLGAVQFCFSLFINVTFLIGAYRAAKFYHKKSLHNLLHSTMGFFDSQPVGRILNRLSKDIESMDQLLWMILFFAMFMLSQAISTLIFLIYIDYRLSALVIPLTILYFFILKYYQKSNIEFKRFESSNKSPLYAHISETLTGLAAVKAFGVQTAFVAKQRRLMDFSNVPTFLRLLGFVWVSIRLQLLSSSVVLVMCIIGVSSNGDPSLMGLAISYAFSFGMFLSALLFALSQLETEFNAVERLKNYCDDIPQEQSMVRDSDPSELNWPLHGSIEFNNVSFAYPSNPDLQILKNLSFTIKAGEKIGIVGRTGSGKSTITSALFRLNQLDQGSIIIDGIDIATLGLKTTRSRLQIIPQDPVLFSGTIKSNLDVESLYLDQALWDTLEQIGLKEYVDGLEDKLESPVSEGGENLSVGQRQLICLGRAILTKPKVLVMDEATASVDREADIRIQESIKTSFKDCTVLCIAHRLNTIADFDRILVLDDGNLAEFDSPLKLLRDPNSKFYQLAEATGPSNFRILMEMASQ